MSSRQFTAFARAHDIGVAFEDAVENPNMVDDKWAREASHYYVTLSMGAKKRMSFHYSKGSALEYGVTVEEALMAVWSDTGSVYAYEGSNDWREWARDLGFEWESGCENVSPRKAEDYGLDCAAYYKAKAAWQASMKMLKKAKTFFGPAFAEFIDLQEE